VLINTVVAIFTILEPQLLADDSMFGRIRKMTGLIDPQTLILEILKDDVTEEEFRSIVFKKARILLRKAKDIQIKKEVDNAEESEI